MHVNCADFVYKAMGELIQVLYQCCMTAEQVMTVENGYQNELLMTHCAAILCCDLDITVL